MYQYNTVWYWLCVFGHHSQFPVKSVTRGWIWGNLSEVYKVPCNLIYSSPPSFLENFIFFPKISVPFPSSPLDNLSYSPNIIEQMILLPLTLFSMWYSSQKPLNYLPLFTTWNSFPKDLINSPPPRGGEWGTLHTPVILWKMLPW